MFNRKRKDDTMNCPRHCKEREPEGLELFWNLPTGNVYICGKLVDVYKNRKQGEVYGVGVTNVPNVGGAILLLCRYHGDYVQNRRERFINFFGIAPEQLRLHHISKTPPQCCPRQGVSLWLCPHCNTISEVQPTFVDGHFSCCACCCGEMTVRFHAPEPTGKELLREILKPGMTVKICDEVLQVASNYHGSTIVKPAYRCGCFLLLVFSLTRFSEKDFKLRVGKSVDSITRSDIEILYDPTEAK